MFSYLARKEVKPTILGKKLTRIGSDTRRVRRGMLETSIYLLVAKQVLVHEVEKQKILQVSRSVHLTDGGNKENLDLVDRKNNDSQFAYDYTYLSGKSVQNAKQYYPRGSTMSSNADCSKSAMSNITSQIPGIPKKLSAGSSSFFDRFRKASSKGSHAVRMITTLERDLRPVLFKFNEGFTDAVKRSVRMREFLL